MIHRHVSPSLVVAIIALVAATGGVGYAAGKIGSKQIVNNSLTSADVKNGTLQEKDLSAKAVAGLAGQNGAPGENGANGKNGANGTNGTDGAQGPAGPAGPTGGRGPTGAAGSNAAVTSISRRDSTQTGSGGVVTVFSEDLPAGSYTIQARTTLSIASGNNASCTLKVDGGEIDRSNAVGPANTVLVFAGFNLAQQRTVTFTCEINGVSAPAASNSSLLIGRVGGVTRSSDLVDPLD